MKTYCSSLEIFTNRLKDIVTPFKVDLKANTLHFITASECTIYPCSVAISDDDSEYAIMISVPVIVSDPKMSEQISDALSRINEKLGSETIFTLGIPEGRINYYTVGETHLIKKNSYWVNLELCRALNDCDIYFPALMRVRYGGHTPEDAVFLSEL